MLDCKIKNNAIQKSNIYAMKKLPNKDYKKCQLTIVELTDYYEFSYIDKSNELNSLKKGGAGIIFKISKNDCKIYDSILLQ